MVYNEENKRFVEGMQASMLAAQLNEALKSPRRYTQHQIDAACVRMPFHPDVKDVLQQVAFSCDRTSMVEWCREAVIERMQRVLNERIAAGEVAK